MEMHASYQSGPQARFWQAIEYTGGLYNSLARRPNHLLMDWHLTHQLASIDTALDRQAG